MTNAEQSAETPIIDVRFSGVGGQGIVLAGRLLGKAAALHDGKEAVCTQTYGPEARGGASRADVVISDESVDYPFVIEADVQQILEISMRPLAPEWVVEWSREVLAPFTKSLL